MIKNLTSPANLLPRHFYRPILMVALMLVMAYMHLPAFAAKPVPAGSGRNADFATPAITSFSPGSGAPGTLLTVRGTGLAGALKVTLGDAVTLIVSSSDTAVVAMIMPKNITGAVRVQTANGKYLYAGTNFTVTPTTFPISQQGPKIADTLKMSASDFGNVPSLSYNLGQGQSVAVSADGNTALVGVANGYVQQYLPHRAVTEYTKVKGIWQKAGIVASYAPGSLFGPGYSIAINADATVAVLGTSEFQVSRNADVYIKKNGVWSFVQNLGGRSFRVSADGNTIASGGTYTSFGGQQAVEVTGVHLYIRNGDTWAEQPGLPEDFNTLFFTEDFAMSADGKTIAGTVPRSPGGQRGEALDDGRAVIYVKASTGWKLQSSIAHAGGGLQLSADGNVLATQYNFNTTDIYIRTGSTWAKAQTIAETGAMGFSADAATIVFPGPLVYYRSGNGSWVKQAAILPSHFASAVAVSANGSAALLGNPLDVSTVQSQEGLAILSGALGAVYPYGTDPVLPQPLTPASTLTFSNTTNTTTTLSFTAGSGNARAVFLKLGTAGVPSVSDGTTYNANPVFAAGTQAGAGWYCVYNGTGSSVNITGLAIGSTYTASVVEYNGFGSPKYLPTGTTAKVTTALSEPIYAPLVFLPTFQRSSTTIGVTWEHTPSDAKAVFIRLLSRAEHPEDNIPRTAPMPGNAAYTANNKFGQGAQIGNSGWFCVYNGADLPDGQDIKVSGLPVDSYFQISVIPYNGSAANPAYYSNTDELVRKSKIYRSNSYNPPTAYATALTFSNTTATSTTLSWVNGNGDGRLVLIKKGTDGAPVLFDGWYYEASNPYTQGDPILQQNDNKDWYCVYNGTGNSVDIQGLLPSGTYKVAVIDYNGYPAGTGDPNFVTRFNNATVTTLQIPGAPATPPTGYATALIFSNTAATATTLSWASSNGAKRAVFLHLGTSGALNVVQGQTYTASSTFKLGTQAGTNGWYCVYNGTGSSVDIRGLTASSTYRAIVLEYNGTAGAEGYNLSRYTGANVTTTAAPILLLTTNQKRMLVEQDVLADNATPELNIHQGLSPNGDEQNDVFIIDGIGAYPENTVKVLNSNGEAIYSATGYNNSTKAFDGHADNGTLQKAGTYFYTLEYKKGAEVIRKTGYLILKF